MELKALLKLIKKHERALWLFVLIGCFGGFVIYYWVPAKYLATGSFYVSRTADTNRGFFTYEGYYSQQAAQAYTNTVLGLLSSVDVQSTALKNMSAPVTETTLRKFAKSMMVKKSGPQLITLTVKGKSSKEATASWESLASALISTNQQINTVSAELNIVQVSKQPVVKQTYKSLTLNIPVGVITGLGLGIFIISLKEYA